MSSAVAAMETELAGRFGDEREADIHRGLSQVSSFWREEDGDRKTFETFVRANFARDEEMRDAMFDRFQLVLEKIGGHMVEIGHVMRRQAELDLGLVYDFDGIMSGYAPGAHITDDFFADKLAFVVLLNFPLTTLDERLGEGSTWSRRRWAEARLAQRFAKRVPAAVNLEIAKADARSDNYIAGYNIWMHHLVDDDGERLFPPKMRLLSHWNLRDELKADYADENRGLEKQQMIVKVMERIVDQTIPAIVVDNPHVDWNPFTNAVTPAAVNDAGDPPPDGVAVSGDREPDTRYEVLLGSFRAQRLLDEYSPTAPTLIRRRFDEHREIPEERVRKMMEDVCSSPLAKRVAALIRERLGRDLEAHDIWFNGFRAMGPYTQEELDRITRERYPDPAAYEADIPRMLRKLGFAGERADYIAGMIRVDPARGSGHASGAGMRGEPALLRTRVGSEGMDYKGFNIAVHEMGHNVEQVLSLNDVDYTLLEGVPNTAFTEAFAFTFQANDLMLLDLDVPEDPKSEAIKTLNDFWMTWEIAGVSLVDIDIWHWMYDHPEATAAELREAALSISKRIWNEYYAPVLGPEDSTILGIYSHIIHSNLYLPDYPMGHLIAFQVQEKMREAGAIGPEFERMAVQGNIAPDLWMMGATGTPVGAEALLEATGRALGEF
ncbi:MAG: hypothetical protein JW876_09125 [Candidatus Krumholzibacteriota bacterium]|nr:hypothetical protein [Candidatus Krumholzibacteriota bacterium]